MLCLVDGPDLATIATSVLSEIQMIEGVDRTFTAPVVPPDRLGSRGSAALPTPQIIRGACYVHIEAEAGAAAGLYERLSGIGGVSGAAVLGGPMGPDGVCGGAVGDRVGVVLEQIHALPGVRSTSTLVSVDYEEPEEDRDQFSSWS